MTFPFFFCWLSWWLSLSQLPAAVVFGGVGDEQAYAYAYAYAAAPPKPCDPLVPESCSLPFPNDYWLVKDANDQPLNLALDTANFPVAKEAIVAPVKPFAWNTLLDGFSPLPCIMAYFPDLSIENCARLWNIAQSTATANDKQPIVIIQASNNYEVPYWVELDHASDSPLTHTEPNRTLMIWPAERLKDGERYVVGIRDLVTTPAATAQPVPVQVSPAFLSLRDNTPSNDSAVNFRRAWFDAQVFPVLADNGFARDSSLQLAWDFTVQSSTAQTATMLSMRTDAFSRIDPDHGGVQYEITSVTENPYTYIGRQINGKMSVPWYLNSNLPGVKVRLVRDWDSDPLQPVYQHMTDVPFELLIPESISNGSIARRSDIRFEQYGHGLFGSYHEVSNEYLRYYANMYGYIVGGVDWIGMCNEDVPFVTEMLLLNLTNFPMVPDRLHQGMLNALFFMKLLMSSGFQNDPRLFTFNGQTVVDQNTDRHYYGNSLGGIMGSVYMSLTTDVIRGVIGVPGFPFELLLPRSADFAFYEWGDKLEYWNDFDRILMISLVQLLWNSLEPAGYINHMSDPANTLADTPVHNVLIHYSLGDAQVTWLGAQQIARTLGCFMFASQVPEYNETLFGYQWLENDSEVLFIDANNNTGMCLIQGWNYSVPQVPFVNVPPPRTYDTHGNTRKQATAQEANFKFFSEGMIYNPCGGPCNGNGNGA